MNKTARVLLRFAGVGQRSDGSGNRRYTRGRTWLNHAAQGAVKIRHSSVIEKASATLVALA